MLRTILIKMIYSFDGSKEQFDKIVSSTEKTKISLRKKYGRRLTDLKDEIAYGKFPLIGDGSADGGYGTDESIKKNILKIQKSLKEEQKK